jgi:exosortase D (VPLPA-CTERM-specific)
MTTANDGSAEKRHMLAMGALLTACMLVLFYPAVENLFYRWGKQQELSHSYFIPLISAWLLWERREVLSDSIGAPSVLGVLLMAASVLLLLLGRMAHIFLLQHLALLTAISALVLLFGGRSLLKAAAFPVAYLLFMIPPPYWIITVTSWQFQLWSSELGVWVIRLFDIPVLLEGNIIDLGVVKLQVVEACSGLRYLFPFLSLAAIAAYVYRGRWWQQLIIFMSAIPITVAMNSVRIALTGALASGGDISHTEGLVHFFEGWMVFILCIALLLLLMFVMSRISGNPLAFVGFGAPLLNSGTPTGEWNQSRLYVVSAISLIVLLLGGIIVYLYNPQAVSPDREPLANLSFSLHEWKPRPARLDVATEQVLGADDYIVADLQGPAGEFMNLYIAYLEAQRDGNSWHSPRQCLPGGGWTFLVEEQLAEDAPANLLGHAYNRLIIKQGGNTFLLYYWYQQRGRIMADEIVMKLWLMWDIATRQRSDGAMVRVMTEIKAEERLEDAEHRLSGFVTMALAPQLDKYVPR